LALGAGGAQDAQLLVPEAGRCALTRPQAEDLHDMREIDVGVVDAVERVGEDGQGDGQRDLGQLLVGVAGSANGGELVLADRAAGLLQVHQLRRQIVAQQSRPAPGE
jgi:hypothetical protein